MSIVINVVSPREGCYWPDEIEVDLCVSHWSSSVVNEDEDQVWYVYYYEGHVAYAPKGRTFHTRCVR